jgi:hypothetical protein
MAKRRSEPVWFEGAREGNILGHPVSVDGPQTIADHKGHVECCIEVDGNVVYYEVGPHGIHSHSHMYANFATPWELAEALVRDYGALAVRGGPSADAPPHDHDGGGGHGAPSHDHGGGGGHGAHARAAKRRRRRK